MLGSTIGAQLDCPLPDMSKLDEKSEAELNASVMDREETESGH